MTMILPPCQEEHLGGGVLYGHKKSPGSLTLPGQPLNHLQGGVHGVGCLPLPVLFVCIVFEQLVVNNKAVSHYAVSFNKGRFLTSELCRLFVHR